MPNEPIIWITAIIALALVVALALWLGRGLVLTKKDKEIHLEIKSDQTKPESEKLSQVSVGSDLNIENSEVGEIAGVDGSTSEANIEVLKGASISHSKIDSISGQRSSGTPSNKPSDQ